MGNRWERLGRSGVVCLLAIASLGGASGCSSSASKDDDATGGRGAGGVGAHSGAAAGATTDAGAAGATAGGSDGATAGSAGATAGGSDGATAGSAGATAGGSGGATAGSAGATAGGAGGDAATAGAGGAYPLPDPDQTGFLTWTYNGQPVGFYLPPPTDEPLPVVMFLHGCGADPISQNFWIVEALNEIEPCAVLLPYRPADESPTCSAWGGTYDDELRPAMVDALAGLDAVIEQYELDGDRQYLYGESMGAEGVLQLLVKFPLRFAGAVVVAGYTVDEGAEQMAQTPLWLIHGSADTINPFDSIDTIHQSILDAGGTLVKFTEYEGLDHSPSIARARSEPGLLEWLLAQRHDGTLRDIPIDIPEDPPATVTLTFEVTQIDAEYEGQTLRLELLEGTADCTSWANATPYSGEGTVADGACEITIPQVQEGAYTACAFIDVDQNAQPSPGDLAGQLSVMASGDTSEVWSSADWFGI